MKDLAILLATYNGENYIEEMLDSLKNQENASFSVYIHDDGSTDKTVAKIEEWLLQNEELDGKTFKMIPGEATGSAKGNFMWMLSQVEADFYMFADQDDVWLKDKVKKSLDIMDKKTDTPMAVFCDMYVTDYNLQILSDSFIRYIGRDPKNITYTQILIDNPAAGCCMLINKSLRDKALELEYISNIKMHDQWILECAAVFGKVKALDEPLVYYRQTGFNEMGATHESKLQKIFRNLGDLFSGRTAENKRAFIGEARTLAREVTKLKNVPKDKLLVLEELSEIEKHGKLYRMSFYKKNNLSRAKGNVWMRLWV